MEEDKKGTNSRYVKYDTVVKKYILSSISFQVWTKYLGMSIYGQSRVKRRDKTVKAIPLNKNKMIWKY